MAEILESMNRSMMPLVMSIATVIAVPCAAAATVISRMPAPARAAPGPAGAVSILAVDVSIACAG
jgi:hypothetical protein